VQTLAQRVRTEGVSCASARRVLRECGRSPYAPPGWRARQLRGTSRTGLRPFVLTAGARRIDYRSAAGAQPPCAVRSYPRRPGGISRGPFVLSPRGLQTLAVGMSRSAAERSSGLDLRRIGIGCERSYVNRRIDIAFTDARVTLVIVSDPAIPTTAGLRVGDPIGRVTEFYGAQASLLGNPHVGQAIGYVIHPTDDPGHEFAIWASDSKVTQIVAGPRGRTVADEYCA
jgi:hypothetical protein